MFHFATISPDTTAFPWAKRTPLRALQSTFAIVLALVLGHVTGHAAAGAIAAGAAFTVGFAVFHEAMTSSLLSMGLLTLGIASATLAGSAAAHSTPLTLLLCVVAAINYGLFMGLSPTSGWIGQQCAVFVIISGGFAQGVHYAVGRTAMVLLGGGLQMLLYALLSIFRRPDKPAAVHLRQLRTRATELWTALRTEFDWNAATTGYVLRLAVVLLVSTAVYREFQMKNGYWAPMTALLVLKPAWADTLSRGIARFLGTLAGAGLGLLAAHLGAPNGTMLLLCVLVFAWACFALQAVNYALFSLCLTLYTVFSFRLGGFSQPAAAHLRLLNTAIGGGLALLVDSAWTLFHRVRQTEPQTQNSPATP